MMIFAPATTTEGFHQSTLMAIESVIFEENRSKTKK